MYIKAIFLQKNLYIFQSCTPGVRQARVWIWADDFLSHYFFMSATDTIDHTSALL